MNDWPPRLTVNFRGIVASAISQMPNKNFREAATISLDSLCEERFQAGLKRGAAIAKEHGDCAKACGNTFKPNTKVRAGWEGGELSARQIESAILQELSEDCSPSVSPED